MMSEISSEVSSKPNENRGFNSDSHSIQITTIPSWRQCSALVTIGPYVYSRNRTNWVPDWSYNGARSEGCDLYHLGCWKLHVHGLACQCHGCDFNHMTSTVKERILGTHHCRMLESFRDGLLFEEFVTTWTSSQLSVCLGSLWGRCQFWF